METELLTISNYLRIIAVLLFAILIVLACLIFKPNSQIAKRATITYSPGTDSSKPKGD
ncbi:hypothetical protein [Rodentibacter trehalosifermentans]|uniref:hypothetical protein n=1 Tax=Rodentibacter trehalosifermentans TaxID=1908263 RepID=UPI0013013F6B|nr:hypothetical protein [Rodentibacter trehalosifermentans]